MAIQFYQPEQLESVITLWLETTIAAHPFIDSHYWYSSESIVRQQYIPNAKNWLYCHNNQVVGFISILEERFVGALFVAQDWQGKGIGTRLMEHVQSLYFTLSLEVYVKNQTACEFYLRRGFIPTAEQYDPDTKNTTLIMSWSRFAPICSP